MLYGIYIYEHVDHRIRNFQKSPCVSAMVLYTSRMRALIINFMRIRAETAKQALNPNLSAIASQTNW